MKAGDRYMAIGEEEFVVEVTNPDTTWDKNDDSTFDARVISFPKRPKRWTNTQRKGETGNFYHKHFEPHIAWIRNERLEELGI